MKLYQLFDKVQCHESDVARILREMSGGPFALVSCVNLLILNPSMSDPFGTIPPISPVQQTIPTPPTPPVLNHSFEENCDLDLVESELSFQQEFTLLSMKYRHP